MYFLAWRDIKVRYKQTLLGAAWAIIQPLMTMVVFSVIFGRLAKLPSDGVPYPLFTLAALLPWQLFAYTMTESSNSLVTNKQLLTKVYFPRLLVPMAAVFAGLADFMIALGLLFVMMIAYGHPPSARVLALPLFVGLAIATALSVGIWLAALNAQYRDVRYAIPFLTQIWLYASPIAYPSSLIPERWRALYGLNPMAGVVEGFRWALLGNRTVDVGQVLASCGVVAVLFVTGVLYFRRMEATFADVV
jgi:lipopolysaccharide transport system permease protein